MDKRRQLDAGDHNIPDDHNITEDKKLEAASISTETANGVQRNIERLKMCFSNTFHVSDLLK